MSEGLRREIEPMKLRFQVLKMDSPEPLCELNEVWECHEASAEGVLECSAKLNSAVIRVGESVAYSHT